jgi:hypothetical protein
MQHVAEGKDELVDVVKVPFLKVTEVVEDGGTFFPEFLNRIRVLAAATVGLDPWSLIGVPHFSQMPRNDGAREFMTVGIGNIVGEFDCRVEALMFAFLVIQSPLDEFLDLLRLLILALLVDGSDQSPAFDFLRGAKLSELVKDRRVSETQLLSYLL